MSVGSLLLVNYHDPIPIFYQFQAESPGQCIWDYVDTGAHARAHWQGAHRPGGRRRKAGHAARC